MVAVPVYEVKRIIAAIKVGSHYLFSPPPFNLQSSNPGLGD